MTILKAGIPEAGYEKKVVLRNVSISVEEGEIVAFIGPNGAGKSTLFKALMGVIKISQGSITFNGTAITNKDPDQIVKKGISLVPQGNRVFTELTVKENLEVAGHLLKRGTVIWRMSQVFGLFPELKDKLTETAGKLSGGEKQQLALARALILEPKILLLDEPSLGLSPKLVTKAFEIIRDVNKKLKTTILIVEQKVHQVLNITDRVYALRMGEIVFEGTPKELQKGNKLKKIFLV